MLDLTKDLETNDQMARRVLVCGGRDFSNKSLLTFMLDQMHKQTQFSVVIHGAARGADTLAGEWAHANGVPVEPYPAEWNKHGRSAGPIRNLRMLADGRPDLVIAFTGGTGTAHMKKVARAHGVQVVEIPDA